MEIIKLTKEKYKEWDKFCLESDDAWFWHTTFWLEYNLNFRSDLRAESLSFFGVENGEIVAACPLIIEEHGEHKEFSSGAVPGMVPIFANSLIETTKKKAMKAVFKEIDRLANEHSVRKASFRFPVLNKSFLEGKIPQNNFLMQFDYQDASINSQIIDLRMTENQLKKGLRKVYKTNIEEGRNYFEVEIFNKQNVTKEIFNKYVELHHKAAGRKTRETSTYDFMYDLIKNNNAILVGAIKDEKFIGFSYFYLYKNNAYYGSSCNDPDVKDVPISHLVQWTAILWMKKKKINFYELGWMHFPNNLEYLASSKELQISEFKRGFGGYTVPLFMGEKYYDEDYFLKTYNERIKNLVDSLYGDKNK